jgi:hypothetical protein
MTPALNSIMRSHNVQFLPIQWRTNFKLDENESRKRAEEGLDNSFSLADITLQKHIPCVASSHGTDFLTHLAIRRMVRELSNEVLIDIPYFMRYEVRRDLQCMFGNLTKGPSHHQAKFIESVGIQALASRHTTQPTLALFPSKSRVSTLVRSKSVICETWESGTYIHLYALHVLRQFVST